MDKQTKKLRSVGTVLKPKFIIGKGGLTANVIENIKSELKKTNPIKIRILGNYMQGKDKHVAMQEIIDKTNTRLVQFIGFTIVLARK